MRALQTFLASRLTQVHDGYEVLLPGCSIPLWSPSLIAVLRTSWRWCREIAEEQRTV